MEYLFFKIHIFVSVILNLFNMNSAVYRVLAVNKNSENILIVKQSGTFLKI